MAILTFPEAQAKAHAELDRVVGRDRLPDFDDHSQLPYLDALLKEIQRFVLTFPYNLVVVKFNFLQLAPGWTFGLVILQSPFCPD